MKAQTLTIASTLALTGLFFSNYRAEAATFTFTGGGNQPNLTEVILTEDGITTTITSTFNQQSALIGISNAEGIGVTSTGETGFNQGRINRGTGNDGEILRFSFTQPVILTAIDFSIASPGNYVTRIDNVVQPVTALADVTGLSLTGSFFEFGRPAGSPGSYAIASITFQPVPEPTTIITSLMLLGGLLPLKKHYQG
ncbi:MAG: hypothetical protein EA365_07920 [Gloeocapsa sp. DLM2.Bin57]|nr:MAG: hypothetical protein EA365_07920 [Gloeocapsa sp. DLM2.Bin57]